MKINWGVLASRLGYGILTGLLGGMAGGQIPTSTGALLSAVTGAAVAAAPSAFQASGILRGVSPDQISLIGSLIGTVSTAISARGQAKQQALTTLAQTAGAAAATAILQKTGAFTAEQLGAGGLSITYNSQSANNSPAAAQVASAQPQTVPGIDLNPNRFAANGQPLDGAIAATGGNQ